MAYVHAPGHERAGVFSVQTPKNPTRIVFERSWTPFDFVWPFSLSWSLASLIFVSSSFGAGVTTIFVDEEEAPFEVSGDEVLSDCSDIYSNTKPRGK